MIDCLGLLHPSETYHSFPPNECCSTLPTILPGVLTPTRDSEEARVGIFIGSRTSILSLESANSAAGDLGNRSARQRMPGQLALTAGGHVCGA